jgi:hypothetical protein
MVQIESPAPPKETNDIMLGFARRKETLVALEAPEKFTITLADVLPFVGGEGHAEAVSNWARSAWDDWRVHHDYIRSWVEQSRPG